MKLPGRGRDDDELPLSPDRQVDDDVRSELDFHIAERAAELEARGMAREQAMTEARALFGDRASIETECRTIEQRRRSTRGRSVRARALRQDITVGLRVLRRAPAFTLAAILTLAVGIGANATVFSIVNQAILQPLPYPDADRIVKVTERHARGWGNLPYPTFLDFERDARSFDAITAYQDGVGTVLVGNTGYRVHGAEVSSEFFRVFAVRPLMGRLPLPGEYAAGGGPVAVVSHAFWRDRLGAPASLTGVRVKLDRDVAVVGVMPAGFDYPAGSELWRPLDGADQSLSRTAHNLEAVGKLRAGISPQSAAGELTAMITRMSAQYAADFDATGGIVVRLQDTLVEGVRKPLFLLFAASAVLLLAACTNLASAQLARGTARGSEFAVRAALGASRLRLVRQLLTESTLLAMLGAGAGLLLARGLLALLRSIAPAGLHLERVHIDGWVAAFAFVVALGTALLFGLYPALRVSEATTSLALREGGRGTGGPSRMRVWHALVASEVALAAMLLVSSAVLVRSFVNVMQVDLGFNATDTRMAQVNLQSATYGDTTPATARFHEAVLARLRGAPGVTAVGFANRLPLEGGNPSGGMLVEGKPMAPNGVNTGNAIYRVVGGDYFAALGIPVLEGRTFLASDDRAAPPVAIVDAEFARLQWPGESAIGKRVKPAGMDGGIEPWHTVVGVVGGVRAGSITSPFIPTYYFDHRQRVSWRSQSVSYAVRGPNPTALDGTVQREIAAVDPQVPVEQGALSRIIRNAMAEQRFTMLLLGIFALLSLILAVVGIHAVVAYAVAQRTREIGVRLALGATPAQVRDMVVRHAMRGVVPGLVLGAVLSFVALRALRAWLSEVTGVDPIASAAAFLLLAVVGVAASVIPARRATRVDPIVAIRAE